MSKADTKRLINQHDPDMVFTKDAIDYLNASTSKLIGTLVKSRDISKTILKSKTKTGGVIMREVTSCVRTICIDKTTTAKKTFVLNYSKSLLTIKPTIGEQAIVSICSIIEFITGEMIDAGNMICQQENKKRVTLEYLMAGIKQHGDLKKLLSA